MRWGFAATVLVVGCYGHLPRTVVAPSTEPLVRADLPGPGRGTYDVQGPLGQRATEAFEVTVSDGRWTVRSERTSAAGTEGFVLSLDAETAEPAAFEVWRQVEDLRHAVQGRREGAVLLVRSDGAAGGATREVPYAAGTMIDARTPTFKAVVLALLGSALRGPAVDVRTLRIDGAWLSGRIVLSSLVPAGEHRGQRLVRLRRAGEAPTGLWVNDEGWPLWMKSSNGWIWRIRSSTVAAP